MNIFYSKWALPIAILALLIAALLKHFFIAPINSSDIQIIAALFALIGATIGISSQIKIKNLTAINKQLQKNSDDETVIRPGGRRQKSTSSDLSLNFKQNTSQFTINILNYQGIRQIQQNFDFDAPWIFLTGANGFGKTKILQALARALAPSKEQDRYNAESPIAQNTIIIVNYDKKVHTIPLTATNDIKLNYRLMGYGASRLNMGSENNTREFASCAGLFEPQVLLNNIEKKGLSRWYFKPNDKHKYDECISIFKQLMPNLHSIEVDDSSIVWYIEKSPDGKPLPKVKFKDLATGNQNIISMVGDILLNLYRPIEDYEAPSLKDNMKAIVLIDEIELYLHPTWQKALPQLLTDLFPNITFIASTHSPLPLLGAPKDSAFYTVKRTQEEGITLSRLDDKIDIDELQPNTVLT